MERVVRKRILLSCALVGTVVGSAFGWDVEHDEVAQLTGEFLPREIQAQFDFRDFATLLANCHFPDGFEWPQKDGRRTRSLEDLRAWIGPADAEIVRAQGFRSNATWLHRERARALVLGLLARAFAAGDHARAAFYVSVLTHQVSDESALNHPPLLHFVQYAVFPGIDYGARKVEEGAKNVFGFRSDGYVVHRTREKMRGYVPRVPTNGFAPAVLDFVSASVTQADYAARQEGIIGFGPREEAGEALADLVTMQVRVLVDMVATAWHYRAADAALPDDGFAARCAARQQALQEALDPAKQAVFAGVFDRRLDPPNPKGVFGVVCEPYGMFSHSQSPYGSRMLGAMCARTLRKNGFAVRGLSYYAVAREGLPDPAEVPSVILFTGGSGYMCAAKPDEAFARQVKAYRDRGGRLVLVGGADPSDLSGFAATMRRRRNDEVPVTAKWQADGAGDSLKMAVVGAPGLPRLGGCRTPFVRNPNVNGFSKAVCPIELMPTEGLTPLVYLDNGRETFIVAGRRRGVTWLPSYLLAPYLFVADDPHLDFANLSLDPFGERTFLALVAAREKVNLLQRE